MNFRPGPDPSEATEVLIDKKAPHLREIDFRPCQSLSGATSGRHPSLAARTQNRDQSFPGQPPAAKQLETLLGRLGVATDTLIIYSDQCDQTDLWAPATTGCPQPGRDRWTAASSPARPGIPHPANFAPVHAGILPVPVKVRGRAPRRRPGSRLEEHGAGPTPPSRTCGVKSSSLGEGTKEGVARPDVSPAWCRAPGRRTGWPRGL